MDWLTPFLNDMQDALDFRLVSIQDVPVTLASVAILVVTLLMTVLLGRMARRAVARMMQRGERGASEGVSYAVGRIAQYLITVAGVLLALENIGISLSTLAAFGAVFAVGLGFGLQNIAQNFISGLILLFERPIAKGDVIVIDDTYGVVDNIAIRATRVMTFDNIALLVPNSKLISEIVENRSEPTHYYRIRVDIGVAYGSNTREVESILLDLAHQHEKVLSDPAPTVFFVDFGESSLKFQLCVWLDDPLGALGVSSTLRHRIVQTFGERGITIPFPQRDIHVKQLPDQALGPNAQAAEPKPVIR